jgi:hypothetical protein
VNLAPITSLRNQSNEENILRFE